jgi:uncharacterized membrane protein
MFSRNRFIRQMRARPRLFISIAVAIATFVLLPDSIARHAVTRGLIAWNVGTGLYLLLATIMIARSSEDRMQRRARLQDEGQNVVLILTIAAAVACLASIGGELAVVKDMKGSLKTAHIALSIATVLSSWAFTHLMFALHYAHDFYSAVARGGKPGLDFPGGGTPDYSDFIYFSAVIGTSGQTADVSLTTRPMRRIGTVHCTRPCSR